MHELRNSRIIKKAFQFKYQSVGFHGLRSIKRNCSLRNHPITLAEQESDINPADSKESVIILPLVQQRKLFNMF